MELNKYQEQAMTTCKDESKNFSYMFLNLAGEVGEFASRVAKAIRYGHAEIYDNKIEILVDELPEDHPLGKAVNEAHDKYGENSQEAYDAMDAYDAECQRLTNEYGDLLKKEAGDILWQLAGLCSVMGWTLEEVAQQNLDKLASRKQRGKIDGDGDNR